MKKILIGSAIALTLMLVLPLGVGAVTNPDALDGLKEFYTLLYNLGRMGIDAYSVYLEALL